MKAEVPVPPEGFWKKDIARSGRREAQRNFVVVKGAGICLVGIWGDNYSHPNKREIKCEISKGSKRINSDSIATTSRQKYPNDIDFTHKPLNFKYSLLHHHHINF